MTTIAPPEADDRWPVVLCTAPECRARVIWAVTERGRPTPVNADPEPGGNLLLVDGATPEGPTAIRQPPYLTFGRTDLRKSHFADCPAASKFRRARRGVPKFPGARGHG